MNFSVPQMPLKNGQYTIPELVRSYLQPIHKVHLWLYCGGRYTEWHYDGHDNFLYVLTGSKTVYMAHPDSIESKNSFSLFSNHVGQKIGKKKVKVVKAVVKRGSCLFIPKGWWHKVYSFG